MDVQDIAPTKASPETKDAEMNMDEKQSEESGDRPDKEIYTYRYTILTRSLCLCVRKNILDIFALEARKRCDMQISTGIKHRGLSTE